MADKLQGTWVFDKFVQERTDINPIKGAGWYLNFSSNGKQFAHLTLAGTGLVNDDYDSPNTCYITYGYPDGVTNEAGEDYEWAFGWFPDAVFGHDSYWTIHIESKYDEVENADTLVRALTARATHTLATGDDLAITYRTPNGVRLNTKDKYCDKDIVVKADLVDKTITANGEYTPTRGGFGKLTVNVTDPALEGVFSGTTSEVSLPNVKSLAKYAFYNNTGINVVHIPNVTSIGNSAFSGCTNLQRVTLSDDLSLGSWDQAVFSGCSNFNIDSLPSKMTYIPPSTFRDCTSLKLSTVPDSVTVLGSNSFTGCNSLAWTRLPIGVTEIGDSAFQNCTNLALTSLPDTIISFGNRIFQGCKKLVTMTFPSSISKIGGYVFIDCTGLTSVTFNGALANLNYPFSGCSALKTLIFRGETVCALPNTSVLSSTLFASGKAGGTLLAPSALVESYKTATNWSVIWGYGTNQFLALEDYTVDGTITGEIDWDKLNGGTA